MAQRERSDGAQRYPGEASKFVRGSSSFPGGGAGAGGARRGAAAGGHPEKSQGREPPGVKGHGESAVLVGKGGRWWPCFSSLIGAGGSEALAMPSQALGCGEEATFSSHGLCKRSF